ncbi:MAG TPA: ABC transporter permease [Thermomicrobiales bacterium]|nr:ABC transporter permease [Thermomicrobiales bacterium]
MMRLVERILGPILILAVLLAAWEAHVRYYDTPAWFLPAPSRIVRVLIDDRGLLAHHARITLQEVLAGFAVALILGLLLAILIHASPLLERSLYPLVIATQAVPLIALAPLLLVWFGYGPAPKIIVTALIAFFPITVGAVDGLRSADRETLEMLRALGAGRVRRFLMVTWPSALPGIFSGARIGVSVAVIGAVFGEYVGADSGLGYLINISAARLHADRVFACIAILAAMSIALFLIVAAVEHRVLRWRQYTTA